MIRDRVPSATTAETDWPLPSTTSARAAASPLVPTSRVTHPINEFTEPYRVINWHVRNGCCYDVRRRFGYKDYLWCARRAATPRPFECMQLITAASVKQAIQQVSSFGTRAILLDNIARIAV